MSVHGAKLRLHDDLIAGDGCECRAQPGQQRGGSQLLGSVADILGQYGAETDQFGRAALGVHLDSDRDPEGGLTPFARAGWHLAIFVDGPVKAFLFDRLGGPVFPSFDGLRFVLDVANVEQARCKRLSELAVLCFDFGDRLARELGDLGVWAYRRLALFTISRLTGWRLLLACCLSSSCRSLYACSRYGTRASRFLISCCADFGTLIILGILFPLACRKSDS